MTQESKAGATEAAEAIEHRVAAALVEFETAPLAMLLLLPDGRLLKANRALRDILGPEFGQAVGKPVWDIIADLIPAESYEAAKRRFDTLLKSSGDVPERTMVMVRDGGSVTLKTASLVARDAAGQPEYVLVRVLSSE